MVNFTLCLFHHNLILKLHILNMYSLLLQLNKVVLKFLNYSLKTKKFPDSSVGKESACNAGDPGSIPGARRSTGERKGYPLQCSGLENFKNYTDHGVTKSQTQLSNLHFHIQVEIISLLGYIHRLHGLPIFFREKAEVLGMTYEALHGLILKPACPPCHFSPTHPTPASLASSLFLKHIRWPRGAFAHPFCFA